jgi:hypothetical protein
MLYTMYCSVLKIHMKSPLSVLSPQTLRPQQSHILKQGVLSLLQKPSASRIKRLIGGERPLRHPKCKKQDRQVKQVSLYDTIIYIIIKLGVVLVRSAPTTFHIIDVDDFTSITMAFNKIECQH